MPLDNCTRRKIAQINCLKLASALGCDCFPVKGVASMFGCEIDNTKDMVLMEAPLHGMQSESMKLESVVYGAWKTLLLNA